MIGRQEVMANQGASRKDWEQLGDLATKTNRTRSKMIGRLIRFFLDNKGVKANGKSNKNS